MPGRGVMRVRRRAVHASGRDQGNVHHVVIRTGAWPLLLLVLWDAAALAQPTSLPDGPSAGSTQLPIRQACDWLVEAAVRKPYGWGWIKAHAGEPLPRGSEIVSMDRLASPAAGLVLLHASRTLGDTTFRDAAARAGAGVAASLGRDGQLEANVLFAGRASGRHTPAPVPDGTATRAGLALLVALADDPLTDQESIRRGAARASRWLREQQSGAGGWPIALPAKSRTVRGARIIRLDTLDSRDFALAMLLAADVLDEEALDRSAELAVRFILSLRTREGAHRYRGLWGTAYGAGGGAETEAVEPAASVDLLATGHAMEVLLASHLLRGDAASLEALDEAVTVLGPLRGEHGLWPRMPSRRSQSPATMPAEGPPSESETLDMVPLIEAVGLVRRQGRQQAAATIFAEMPLRQRITAVLTGLERDLVGSSGRPAGDDLLGSRIAEAWRLTCAAHTLRPDSSTTTSSVR
jgi:hypothetical protein